MRELKFHEKKLLKKVDFLRWKSDPTYRQNEILNRYRIQKRDDYVKYNYLVGTIRKLSERLAKLDPTDPFRVEMSRNLVAKLYNMGIISNKSLQQCHLVNVSAFCRRRLPVVLLRLRMASNLKDATKLIEQGHIRVGPQVVDDPAFLVTRTMEDFVTWVDKSKIKRHILKYNDKLDDYDLLN
jgi:U3 small nucleolar ribonucleoprotein protein IMP3